MSSEEPVMAGTKSVCWVVISLRILECGQIMEGFEC